MADSPTQKFQQVKRAILNRQLRRAILNEVYVDNLEGNGKPLCVAVQEPVVRPDRGKIPRVLLALLPVIGMLIYIFLQLQASITVAAIPDSQAIIAVEKTKVRSATANRSLAIPTTPYPAVQNYELSENLPRYYEALLGASDISLAQLFGLDAKTIVIDPGHGGRDPGAIGPGGLQEKDVTLKVALQLRDRLKKYPGYRILMTRDSDVKISTRERVAFANEKKADLFISVHCNSLVKTQLNIIETYYFGAQADEDSLRLAEAENQGSEYLMAEFKGMIKKIGDNFKQQESKALASSIQDNLFRQMKAKNDKVVNRGTKMAPFVVLLGADMPSVLAEIICISNSEEAIKLADPAYIETFARHLEGGIIAYLNRTHSNSTNTNSTNGAKRNGEKRRTSGRASEKG
jgi:N-acetylmuramoyl-L-alanine amidase